jgi:hypothetical protein
MITHLAKAVKPPARGPRLPYESTKPHIKTEDALGSPAATMVHLITRHEKAALSAALWLGIAKTNFSAVATCPAK